ncbi:YggS family pyridoxal phosphate-dependent enzyme [Zeaxanthinibacter sp. PT1]|uniref:YggS family pyridoxal phosphate-dependent enzyme n=1 Tax=Zeaxanthinibacter TaxID=561554 RepID=UPI0023497B36|nr:YggS family pyridoxal phosphate-dependent enzyme [Zeaxanthinibacter sp. PT1]MDC6351729.1 YggS family pyridoxal phosphate-dependent enzyme [Zeaxanthinibacter sp. PT1]
MNIKENLESIREDLPGHVTLVAVSKTKSTSLIMEAYEAGQRDFGENKVQEMTAKWEELPKDIRWHMIGHVQRNKVKYMSDFVSLIHGVDSHRLLVEINKRAEKSDRVIDCLLQVHIAEEESKFGFDEAEIIDLLDSGKLDELKNVRLIGLMGMATFTEDNEQVRREFRGLKKLYDRLKERLPHFRELSMGMSGDYHIGIEEGSTMVRIGSSIFGARN